MPRNLDDYVTVHERLQEFYEKHPEGAIRSEILVDDGVRVQVRASVWRERPVAADIPPDATGHAEEIRGPVGRNTINETSAVENCETSAWGRALAALGLAIRHSVASREEIEIAERVVSTFPGKPVTPHPEQQRLGDLTDEELEQVTGGTVVADPPQPTRALATAAQRNLIAGRAKRIGMNDTRLRALLKLSCGESLLERVPKLDVDAVLHALGEAEKEFARETSHR